MMMIMIILIVRTITIIIWATGTIPTSLGQYLSNKPGKREVKELQKKKRRRTAILCTAQHSTAQHSHTQTAGSANVRVRTYLTGGITCSTNCTYRTASALRTLETWFVSGT